MRAYGRVMAVAPVNPHAIIRKEPGAARVAPNMPDYEAERASFSWESARAELDGLPGGGLNIAYEAVDRHATGPLADHVAIRWLGKQDERRDITYRELRELTDGFANVLDHLGVLREERVFALAGRIPELYIAALGTLKRGAVFCPLFSAFGPEPIQQRMLLGDAKLLVTTPALYEKKIAPIRHSLPALEHVLLVGHTPEPIPDTLDLLELLMHHVESEFQIPPTGPESMALLHFTSGTTGTPKGAVHVHDAVVAHHASGRIALDLHPDDVFWCTADPGWVTGTSYGIIAPLVQGVTSIVDEAEFDADRWYGILESERVTVWYTAPTAIRMLMKVGAEAAADYDLSALRFVASVGEPLNPEGVVWGEETYGLPIHDNWWQTETGGIMISNYASMDVKPGSMGRPLPGVEAAILRRDDQGNVVLDENGEAVLEDTGMEGELALRPGWPSMFRAYLHESKRYRKCFVGGWYLTGDLARMDADGYFWFVGRADDVIKSAGHLIGPFEVESALLEHEAVAEAGVIGVPDPVVGEAVKAYVTLKPHHEPSDALRRELIGFARKRLGPAVAPRAIEFDQNLPHTRSGKIVRRLVRARDLGLPEGDVSTLEGAS